MAKARILVVEDETDIRELIALHLSREGHSIESSDSGSAALELIKSKEFDLLVLDWMLPGLSGVELTKQVRKIYSHEKLRILMVTAKTTSSDLVMGLEAGADDYLSKPFELSILTARARALLRRTEVKESLLTLGPLKVDEHAHEVTVDDQPLSLTPYEFRLLITLLQNKGRVLTRDKLIEEVQGSGVAVVERAIDTHVFGLRKKLGDRADFIETVRGVGYRIAAKS